MLWQRCQTNILLLTPNDFFLEHVIPVDGDQPNYHLLGTLLCLRTLIPHLSDPSNLDHGLKGSFGNTAKDIEDTGNREQLIKVVRFC